MDQVISVNNLTKKYDDFTVVDNVSFDVTKGSILGFLGPNGAGKTTTVKSILDLIRYDEGEILINGLNMKHDKHKVLSDIGAVLEGSRNIYWYMSPSENIDYFAGIMGLSSFKIRKRKEQILKRLNLWDVRDKDVREFSKGMKQKTSIACSIIHDPSILFLDEPALGLDVETKNDIKKMLNNLSREENKTIMITSHNMDLIESVCDKVSIINDGKLISHSKLSILKNSFSKKCYEIQGSKNILNLDKDSLTEIGDFKIEKYDNYCDLKIYIKNSNIIYQLFDLLKENNITIKDINIQESSLEDIFVDLINNKEKQ